MAMILRIKASLGGGVSLQLSNSFVFAASIHINKDHLPYCELEPFYLLWYLYPWTMFVAPFLDRSKAVQNKSKKKKQFYI